MATKAKVTRRTIETIAQKGEKHDNYLVPSQKDGKWVASSATISGALSKWAKDDINRQFIYIPGIRIAGFIEDIGSYLLATPLNASQGYLNEESVGAIMKTALTFYSIKSENHYYYYKYSPEAANLIIVDSGLSFQGFFNHEVNERSALVSATHGVSDLDSSMSILVTFINAFKEAKHVKVGKNEKEESRGQILQQGVDGNYVRKVVGGKTTKKQESQSEVLKQRLAAAVRGDKYLDVGSTNEKGVGTRTVSKKFETSMMLSADPNNPLSRAFYSTRATKNGEQGAHNFLSFYFNDQNMAAQHMATLANLVTKHKSPAKHQPGTFVTIPARPEPGVLGGTAAGFANINALNLHHQHQPPIHAHPVLTGMPVTSPRQQEAGLVKIATPKKSQSPVRAPVKNIAGTNLPAFQPRPTGEAPTLQRLGGGGVAPALPNLGGANVATTRPGLKKLPGGKIPPF